MAKKRSIFEEVGTGDAKPARSATPGVISKATQGARGAVRAWLMALFALVVVMIAVGGLTRLTDSGLSITEWAPVTGAIPPMSEADWASEFEKYQQIPEFELQNNEMTLAEFKVIYWWEWGHRQLGRVIGLVWAIGFVGLLAAKKVPAGWTGRLLLLGALGGAQGAIGWWMVASGLEGERLDVASYRLATHLGLAFVILGLIAWYVNQLGRDEGTLIRARRIREARLFGLTGVLAGLVFLQIVLGALVAGIDAGRTYTDWPLMAGSLFPPQPFGLTPLWRNFFEDPGLVQFVHRVTGYVLLAFGIYVWRVGRRSPRIRTRRTADWMMVMLFGQMVIGVVTVLHGAPWQIAIVHQFGAVVLWTLALRARFLAGYPIEESLGPRMTAYDDLMAFTRETVALEGVAGRMGWDQETVMPPGAAPQRSEEMAVLAGLIHARRVDPRVGDWLDSVDQSALDPTAQAQIREIARSYLRTARIPARLASELARVTSRAQGIWARARAANDFAAFAPTLEEVVRLTREKALALADGGDAYDALLDDYEPGASAAELEAMFGALRPRLVALRDRIMGAPAPKGLSGTFPEAAQLALARDLALAFGYDMNHGRIDEAVHPFSSGSGLDVRITTRTAADDPFNCFYSTIHEVGHASYEQGVDPDYLFTPLGQGVSMGVHESQSRIYENQLGRSRAFTGWLYGRMREAFGDIGIDDAEAFYAAVNRVHKGYIRTEADEVQYNLHVLLRFDLERQLISGALDVGDLEAAWNARFEADFGYPVDKPANGVLQDVHWSVGLFGYFSTYSLGNVYAGCLHAALRAEVPGLDTALGQGDAAPATTWLRAKLQRFGALRPPRDTIRHATGAELSEGPLLDYLETKFSEIYRL